MGREVCRAVTEAVDLDLVAAVDPVVAGAAIAELVDGGPDRTVVAAVDDIDPDSVDVLVDFTVAEVAERNLAWCAERGVHAVVGTTGLGERALGTLRKRFEEGPANAVVVANFAIGAVLLMRFCEVAAPLMESVEIIELHHDQKRDAPSGTALRTAEQIAAARRAAGAGPLPPDPTTQLVLEGARGGEGPGGVRVHSVRLPGLVAHEEVIFGALGQSLTLRHDSYDRRSFMPGVLLAVRSVVSTPGLTMGLEPLLGI